MRFAWDEKETSDGPKRVFSAEFWVDEYEPNNPLNDRREKSASGNGILGSMRRTLAVFLSCVTAGLPGCGGPREGELLGPEWRLSARVEFVQDDFETARSPTPTSTFYLAFPFIGGDIYGSITTRDFARHTREQ